MTEDTDTDICDRLSRLSTDVTKLTKVLSQQKPPVVNVAAPAVSAPSVNVQPPSVNVSAPNVTVQKQTAESWTFKVTKRDRNGYIETFTATPAT